MVVIIQFIPRTNSRVNITCSLRGFSHLQPRLYLLQANPKKGILTNTAYPIIIKLLNHILQLLLFETILPQIPRHPPQVLKINIFLMVHIEQVKSPFDLLSRVSIVDLLRGDASECVLWD